MKYQRIVFGLALLVVAAWPVWSQSKDDFFETRVRPILATECFSCHTDSQLGGLRLDSREAMMRGGKSGPAIIPGEPDKSLLLTAVRQTGALKMPKGGKLAPDQIEAIAEWIRSGAVWPASRRPSGALSRGSPRRGGKGAVRWCPFILLVARIYRQDDD